jgi:23S rRNA (adenine2503-C2)-methyltransferase
MPVNNKWNVAELLSACREYYQKCGRRISFEYTLISGENDSEEDAAALGKLLKKAFSGTGAPIHVNLIRVNEVKETGFKRGSKETVEAFSKKLTEFGIVATLRRRLGADVNAACGKLRKSRMEAQGQS